MPVLSTRIVLDCFYLLIFYPEKFSTDVCRLPYAVNVNLNLSSTFISQLFLDSEYYSGPGDRTRNLPLCIRARY